MKFLNRLCIRKHAQCQAVLELEGWVSPALKKIPEVMLEHIPFQEPKGCWGGGPGESGNIPEVGSKSRFYY